MVYLGKQIKTSNMLQKRAVGVEEKRRRLGRLRRERSTLAAVSRGDRHHSYCDVWGVDGWGIGRLPLPLVTGWREAQGFTRRELGCASDYRV